MTEHTHTGNVFKALPGIVVRVPQDWPVGAEVTVTWTEPPEPTGRWVVVEDAGGLPDRCTRPAWEVAPGHQLFMTGFHRLKIPEVQQAEAALVDLIESDHLPPLMPSVDDIYDWLTRNGYRPRNRAVIRGTLDAIAALAAHARGPE